MTKQIRREKRLAARAGAAAPAAPASRALVVPTYQDERDMAFLSLCRHAQWSEPRPGVLQLGHLHGEWTVTRHSRDLHLEAGHILGYYWQVWWFNQPLSADKGAYAYARKVLQNQLGAAMMEIIAGLEARLVGRGE